jgi:hypothetical protein
VSAYQVNTVINKGPLLTIALALFGPESFVADRVTHPEVYVNSDQSTQLGKCIDRMPFLGLLRDSASSNCITNDAWNFGQLQSDMMSYIQIFIELSETQDPYYDGPSTNQLLENAFDAAAFLANEQYMTNADSASFTMSYDEGVAIQKPHISKASIILISTLLAIFLVALLAMAFYSNRYSRWTRTLDSLMMMQYGAAVAEHLPFHVVADSSPIKILDEIPGWVGDATDGRGEVGELGLGAATPLRGRRRYRCFDHDCEVEEKPK